MNYYDYINNPQNNQYYSINSKEGRKILQKYIEHQSGGNNWLKRKKAEVIKKAKLAEEKMKKMKNNINSFSKNICGCGITMSIPILVQGVITPIIAQIDCNDIACMICELKKLKYADLPENITCQSLIRIIKENISIERKDNTLTIIVKEDKKKGIEGNRIIIKDSKGKIKSIMSYRNNETIKLVDDDDLNNINKLIISEAILVSLMKSVTKGFNTLQYNSGDFNAIDCNKCPN